MLFLVVMFSGCKKESNENPDNNTTQSITPEKSTVAPYEVITLTVKGITLSADSYSGSIGDKEAVFIRFDDRLSVIVPDIPPGKHTLSVTISESVYNSELTVLPMVNISNPEEYIGDLLETANQKATELEAMLAEWDEIIDPAAVEHDLAIIYNNLNEASLQMASASAESRQIAANMIAANQPVMDSLTISIDSLQLSLAELITLRKNGKQVEDLEAKIEASMKSFVLAVMKTVANIHDLRVLLSGIAIGAIVAPPAGPIIGAIMVGWTIGSFIRNWMELYQAETILLDYALSVADVPDPMKKSGVLFQNNEETIFPVSSNYHNINSQSASSGFSLLASVAGSVNNFAEKWNEVMDILPSPLQLEPPFMSELTQVKTANARVHAKYLKITNISNPAVTVNFENINGELKVQFTTTDTTDVNFTFNLEYSNPEIFEGSTTVSATLQIGVPAVVTTFDVIVVDANSAVGGGDVSSEGNTPVTAKGLCWSTTQNPTINNSHTTDGSGLGNFSSVLTGLTAETKYYVRAYATNSGGTSYGNEVSFTTHEGNSNGLPCQGMPTVLWKGQTYNTVQIGGQCWMKENMNWATGNSYCYNYDLANCAVYGRLYTWSTALNVCPPGWHLPSDNDWKILEGEADSQYDYPDPEWNQDGSRGYDAGINLIAENGWGINIHGTDLYGLSVLPGGHRDASGQFSLLGIWAPLWTSTPSEFNNGSGFTRIFSGTGEVNRNQNFHPDYMFSVRCLRDN